MPLPGSRPAQFPRWAGRGTAPALVLAPVLALTLALAGCADDKKKASGPPPPPPSEQPEQVVTNAPGSKSFDTTTGLRKPITYEDKVTVVVSDIRYVRNEEKGPGEMTGKLLTIFTLKFTNGSAQPLDLNKVKVVARYGSGRTQASPTSYANLNDFYGTVAPGRSRSASYAFDLPRSGYGSVVLGVNFDEKRKTAVFAGSLKQ